MTAEQVVLDGSSFWALVALVALTSLVALVAAVAALRSAKSARTALGGLETARRELVVIERRWQERSPIPGRAQEATLLEARDAGTAPPGKPSTAHLRPPAAPLFDRPVPSAPRYTDSLEDPDGPGSTVRANASARRSVPAPVPEELRTEPLSARRPSVAPGPAVISPPAAQVAPPRHEPPFSDLPAPVEPARAPAFVAAEPGPGDAAADGTAGVGSSQGAPPNAPEPPRPPDPAAARLRRLQDPDPFVRIEAIEGLRGHPALLDALLRALHDDFPVVRRQAVRALKEVGGPQATRALLDVATQDTSAEVREEAVGALAAMLRDARSSQHRA